MLQQPHSADPSGSEPHSPMPPLPPAQSPLRDALARAEHLEKSGEVQEAESICREVLRARPDMAAAFHLLGAIALRRGATQAAIEHWERAIALDGTVPEWHEALCHLYRRLGLPDQALNLAHAAARLRPDHGPTQAVLASVLMERREIVPAIACIHRAISLDLDHAPSHFLLAQLLLLKGEMRPGWLEYEWMARIESIAKGLPKINAPKWNGMTLPGGRILLVGDQGFGDTLQFSRYIPRVAERCTEVVVGCSPELLPIVSRVPGIARICQRWDDIPPFAAFSLLSSLPGVFGTEIDTIPASVPYLEPDRSSAERWGARLAAELGNERLRVGIVWSGRPTHANDAARSMTLAHLAPLAGIPGIAFISLQKDPREGDRANLAGPLAPLDFTAELGDFSETAAVVANLDLVIAVDTAVAHLAGALGKPAWVMLPWVPDWRWLMDREDSPWYPTMRLFRQPGRGQWEPVVAQVAAELAAVAGGARERLLPQSGGALR